MIQAKIIYKLTGIAESGLDDIVEAYEALKKGKAEEFGFSRQNLDFWGFIDELGYLEDKDGLFSHGDQTSQAISSYYIEEVNGSRKVSFQDNQREEVLTGGPQFGGPIISPWGEDEGEITVEIPDEWFQHPIHREIVTYKTSDGTFLYKEIICDTFNQEEIYPLKDILLEHWVTEGDLFYIAANGKEIKSFDDLEDSIKSGLVT
jgi:hypothetical protein